MLEERNLICLLCRIWHHWVDLELFSLVGLNRNPFPLYLKDCQRLVETLSFCLFLATLPSDAFSRMSSNPDLTRRSPSQGSLHHLLASLEKTNFTKWDSRRPSRTFQTLVMQVEVIAAWKMAVVVSQDLLRRPSFFYPLDPLGGPCLQKGVRTF